MEEARTFLLRTSQSRELILDSTNYIMFFQLWLYVRSFILSCQEVSLREEKKTVAVHSLRAALVGPRARYLPRHSQASHNRPARSRSSVEKYSRGATLL